MISWNAHCCSIMAFYVDTFLKITAANKSQSTADTLLGVQVNHKNCSTKVNSLYEINHLCELHMKHE